jgi:probable HAF family extracellular repeat protein
MTSKTLTLFLTAFMTQQIPVARAQSQAPKVHPPSYAVINLGTPLGGQFSTATSVNVLGWVGGYGNLSTNTNQHALLWRNGNAKDLGTLGGPDSALYGTYSGFSETSKLDPLGQDFCAYGTHLICLPFLLGADSLIPLTTLGGDNAVAYANNNIGQVAGTAQAATADPACLVDGQPQPPFYTVQTFLPAVWQFGHVKSIPLLPGDSEGETAAINDLGEAVGFSGGCLTGSVHAWLWKEGKVTNLGSLGGQTGNAAASINNFGEITGNADLTGDATYHAFLWRNGVMMDLGTLSGDYSSYGNSINDEGQIVGESCDSNTNCRPFFWENGVMMDLNSLVTNGSNLYLLDALTINDLGEIVGYASDQTTGTTPAFLATVSNGASKAALAQSGMTADSELNSAALGKATRPALLRQRRFGIRAIRPSQ